MIAAHAWDVFGATRHGLNAVWIDQLEHEWPLPVTEAEHRATDLCSAATLVADLTTA
jgi:hypothetical protein